MSRLFSWLGNLAAYVVIAVILLSVLRPDLVSIPTLSGASEKSQAEPDAPSFELEIDETIEQDWQTEPDSPPGDTRKPHLHIVRLTSPDLAHRIGLQTTSAEARHLIEQVEGNAETAFNGHRYAEIVPRVACVVREVLAERGTQCQPGDRLAMVDSAEVGTAKANYLSARAMAELAEATLERTITLSASDALPKARELEARATLNTARADLLGAAQRLRNFGYSNEDLEQIAKQNDTSSLLDIISPIKGTVVDLHAVIGEALEPSTVMFLVTDLSTLWTWIDVPEADYTRIDQGQPVVFDTHIGQESRSKGVVEWVDASVDPVTRTVRVLASLDNSDEQLRANQFGWGSIVVGEPRATVVVSREAIQDLAPGISIAFIDRGNGSYQPRRVQVQPTNEPGMVEVVRGLNPGDSVVTTGAFFLMSEMRRDELAGD